MNRKCDVLIIGGGIIGASSALELSRRGVQTLVIDKGELGHGCSYGNAGWVTPCFAFPLPRPGMLLKSIGWMLDPEGPLYIKPKPSLLLMRWLLRFLLSMNSRHLQNSIAALTEISKYSLDAYAELHRLFPEDFGFSQKGLMMVAQSEAGLHGAVEEMDIVARHGIRGSKLDEAAVKDLEPAIIGTIKGGVYFPDEAHLEPLAVVKTMMKAATELGAEFAPRTEAFEFNIYNGKIVSVRTTQGVIEAEQVILGTGVWSESLVRTLGLNIPVLGGKGYSLIVKPFAPSPTIPLMLIEKKIAVTPRDGSIRIAGTLELVEKDEGITVKRVDAIIRGAQQFLNVSPQPEILEIWRGLRPCTPDGVPIMGRSRRYRNLVIATGHQMLGLQSGPGSGRLVADIITGSQPCFDLKPFRLERF